MKLSLSHTHTHMLNGPFSGTNRVRREQKSETNLAFTEARDSDRQWHQLDHMQSYASLHTTRVDDLPGRRTHCSTNANRLVVPPVKLSTVGSRAFAVATPHI